ncbi:hypothetical protein ABZ863_30990 [Saccharomonospora sp. NPDC046836]|uniref:hypothetical protein n=1 Tax=Saccharomonospora sp. NPDC046836 TaxID=3156921 RepID=UPI0033E5D137
MTPNLQDEWKRHATRFMTRWLVMMEQRCRVRRERDRRISDLRSAVATNVTQEEKRNVILKDIHITEAAIFLKIAVFSFDEKQRRVLSELQQDYSLLGDVQWFNPESDIETLKYWIDSDGHDKALCAVADFA